MYVINVLSFQDGGNQKQKWSKSGRLIPLRQHVGVLREHDDVVNLVQSESVGEIKL